MSISTNSVTSPLFCKDSSTTQESNLLKDQFHNAIKGYKDEYYTGLTDEERAAILKEQKAYLSLHPLKTQADIMAFNTFTKNLLNKYGYKGDSSEFLIQTDTSDETKLSDAQFAYEQSICTSTSRGERVNDTVSPTIPSSALESTSSDATNLSDSIILTNPDGSQKLVLYKDDIILAEFNLGEVPTDSEDDSANNENQEHPLTNTFLKDV